jgi:phosphoribosylformylglycinamidine (FGAM) synthase PurS component
MEDIIEIRQTEMLQAINRAEVDVQVSTAKQYPRDIHKALNTISTLAAMDAETAEDCFYALKRKGADGSETLIEGVSVRMAEIIASSWGNMRVQTRIIGNDGKTVTAQGICHDLEANLAVSVEVKRRITDRKGKTFSEDMQVVTGNAASAIAFRNAVLKVVPKAVTKRVIEGVKQVALGKATDLETSRRNALASFAKAGVGTEHILFYLGISGVEEIDMEKVFVLRGTWNAIKEGTTSVEEAFIKPMKAAEEAKKTVADKKGDLRKSQSDKPELL